MSNNIVLAAGIREYDPECNSAWVNWWLMPRNHPDPLSVAGEPQYSGPGRFFARAANIRVSKSYVLVTQRRGYDI